MHTRPQPGVPAGNPDSKPFWDGCARNELLLQRCTACGVIRHPPSPVCTICLSDAHEWFAASGKATIYTYTIVRQALARGWDERIPYVVAVVELDEGPKFMTNIVNVDPEIVAIGMPVEVTFAELDGTTKLPNFQPRSS